MSGDGKYVFWVERPGDMWRAYFHGKELFIRKWPDGFVLEFPDYTHFREKPFPSLNLAKRAGSEWLRKQAEVNPAKPGGGRPGTRRGHSLWVRIGDADDYEKHGQDFDSLALQLVEFGVLGIDQWIKGGLEYKSLSGMNYVSLYWGDREANLIRDLNKADKKEVTEAIRKCVEEYRDSPGFPV